MNGKSPTASVRQTADARPFGDVDAAGGAVGIQFTAPAFGRCKLCGSPLLMARIRGGAGSLVAVCVECDVVKELP